MYGEGGHRTGESSHLSSYTSRGAGGAWGIVTSGCDVERGLGRQFAAGSITLAPGNGRDSVVLQGFHDVRRDRLFGIIKHGVEAGIVGPDFAGVEPCHEEALGGVLIRAIKGLKDSLGLSARFRNDKIEQVIEPGLASELDFGSVPDFTEVEPDLDILKEEVGYHRRGEKEHVIDSKHCLDEVVFPAREVVG